MFKTILVAIDGSGYAREAHRVANDLAKTYGSRLVLLHVVDNKPLPKELRHFAEMEDVTAPTLPTAVGERILDDWQRRAAESGVSDIKTLLREGDPAGQIIEAAKDQDADVIVMGFRGHGALAELLLGSVSHKVGQLAPCTCMTVR